MLNEDKPLQFGNPEIEMIEKNISPLLMNGVVQSVMKMWTFMKKMKVPNGINILT
jgi:hypothetical protein